MSWNFWFVPEPNWVLVSPAGIVWILLCVLAIPCSDCHKDHTLKYSCFWLLTGYILLFKSALSLQNIKDLIKLENQWHFHEHWTHSNTMHWVISPEFINPDNIRRVKVKITHTRINFLSIFDENKSSQDILFTRLCFIFIQPGRNLASSGWGLRSVGQGLNGKPEDEEKVGRKGPSHHSDGAYT